MKKGKKNLTRAYLDYQTTQYWRAKLKKIKKIKKPLVKPDLLVNFPTMNIRLR
jgi:hypothetical protein